MSDKVFEEFCRQQHLTEFERLNCKKEIQKTYQYACFAYAMAVEDCVKEFKKSLDFLVQAFKKAVGK